MEAQTPEHREREELQKARDIINNVKEKSDDDYEKSVSLISSGTLVLSLTFIEKIVNLPEANNKWSLIASWIFMALTLIINLISHQLSSYFSELESEELVDRDIDPIELLKRFKKRNKRIRRINIATTITLLLGMSFLILFCSFNATNMSKKNPEVATKQTTVKPPVKNNEERGRTNQIPTSVLEAGKPKVTSQPGGTTGQADTDKTK